MLVMDLLVQLQASSQQSVVRMEVTCIAKLQPREASKENVFGSIQSGQP
jgi:hypothetical protein